MLAEGEFQSSLAEKGFKLRCPTYPLHLQLMSYQVKGVKYLFLPAVYYARSELKDSL